MSVGGQKNGVFLECKERQSKAKQRKAKQSKAGGEVGFASSFSFFFSSSSSSFPLLARGVLNVNKNGTPQGARQRQPEVFSLREIAQTLKLSKQNSDCTGREKHNAETRDRTRDLLIFGLTLSQLS